MLELLRGDLIMVSKELPIFLSAVVFCLLKKYLWNDYFLLGSVGRVVSKTGLILALIDLSQKGSCCLGVIRLCDWMKEGRFVPD